MNSQEARAVLAAQRAYKGAITAGAEGRIALDVACAAYRVFHPVMGDREIRNAIAAKIGLPTKARRKPDAA